MYDEPDIVKMLREAEKLGKLQSNLPSPSEEFEVQESSSEDAPYESDDFAENTVKTNTMDKDVSSSSTEKEKIAVALKESEERYKALFNSTPDLICETDDKGNILAANSNMIKSMGVPPEKLIGKNIFDILPREIAEQRAKIARKAFEEMKNLEYDDERAGRYFHNIYVPIIHPDGKKTIQLIARDTTDQKKAEGALRDGDEKWASLTRNTNDVIMIVDHQGIIQYISKTLPSYTPKETIGKTIYEYVPKDHHDIMNNSLTKVFKTGEQDNYVVSSNIPKIGTMWFSTKVIPVKRDGAVRNVIMISTDITERKRAEEEIRYLKDYNENILESNPNPILVVKGTQIEYVNKSFVSIFGETKNEYITRNLKDVVPSEIFPVFENLLQEDGRSNELKFRGKEFIVHSFVIKKAEEEEEEGEEETRRGMVFQDITERKKAEEELKESEEKFRDLFENANDLIQSADANGRFIYVNKKWLRTLGYTEDEVKGLTITDIFRKDQIPHCMEIIKEVRSGKSFEKVEAVFVSKDGREIYVEGSANAKFKDGEFIATRSIFRDITERKRAEEHIKKQNEFVETVINSLQYPLYAIDKDYDIVLSNKAAKEKGIVDGSRCYQLTHHSQEPCSGEHICPLKEVFRTGKPIVTEHIHYDNDGNARNFDVHGDPIFDKDGQVIQMIEYSIDITERKKAEDALKEAKAFTESALNSITDIFYSFDLSGKLLSWNKTLNRISGYSDQELSSKKATDFFLGEDIQRIVEAIERMYKEGTSKTDANLVLKDGRQIPCEFTSSILKGGKGNIIGFSGTGRDITERKKMDEELGKSKIRMDMATETSQIGVWEIDLINDTSIRNLIHDQIFGYNEKISEWGAKIFFEHIISEDRPSVQAAFDSAMKTNKLYFECRILWPNKSVHWITVTGKVVRDNTGKPQKMLGTVTDITNRKKAEKELKEKIEELERYKKLTVDRELKMMDLKKRITELEEKSMKR